MLGHQCTVCLNAPRYLEKQRTTTTNRIRPLVICQARRTTQLTHQTNGGTCTLHILGVLNISVKHFPQRTLFRAAPKILNGTFETVVISLRSPRAGYHPFGTTEFGRLERAAAHNAMEFGLESIFREFYCSSHVRIDRICNRHVVNGPFKRITSHHSSEYLLRMREWKYKTSALRSSIFAEFHLCDTTYTIVHICVYR